MCAQLYLQEKLGPDSHGTYFFGWSRDVGGLLFRDVEFPSVSYSSLLWRLDESVRTLRPSSPIIIISQCALYCEESSSIVTNSRRGASLCDEGEASDADDPLLIILDSSLLK